MSYGMAFGLFMLIFGAFVLLILWLQQRALPALGYGQWLPFARVVGIGMVVFSWLAAAVALVGSLVRP